MCPDPPPPATTGRSHQGVVLTTVPSEVENNRMGHKQNTHTCLRHSAQALKSSNCCTCSGKDKHVH